MSNSILKQQLEKLKQNQKADPILPTNSSATFLFDFKNANKIDKDTTFEIGYSGIIELSRLNRKFIRYIPKLFNNTSKYFQRETRLSTELKDLDLFLEELVVDLIDYFHLKASHKIIEYLIKIYNFNAYNPKYLILAFLPYHETNYFTKLVQNVNLDLIKNFKFMMNFGRAGTVVLEEFLFKEILNNFDLLKEIFNFYEEKVIRISEIKNRKNNEVQDRNFIGESEKYFKFIYNLVKYYLENMANKKIDKSNFFILIINFIRLNIKHFKNLNNFADDEYISTNNKENNYIIQKICELVILINSKYSLNYDYANAILNDMINNFLFFKNKKDINNNKSLELVVETSLLFVSQFENKENNKFLRLNKETLDIFFENIKFNEKNKKNTLMFILENLSIEYNFYPFLKMIISSIYSQILSEYSNQELDLNNENLFESENTFKFYLNKIFEILKIIKITKEEILNLSNYLINLDTNPTLSENLHINLEKVNFTNSNFILTKIIQKTFIYMESIYTEEFNYFLIKYFEGKKNDKTKIMKYLKNLDNYKLISTNEENLLDLFINLNTTSLNPVINSIEKIDFLINENKTDVVKFSFKSLINKFNNFEQEFILNKILEMKNFNFIINFEENKNEINKNKTEETKTYKEEILEFYFKILEEKISLYSDNFIEKLNLFILHNLIKDTNDPIFLKYFVYFYIYDLKISKESVKEFKYNKFINNLISETTNNKKIEEFTKILSSSNAIKSLNIIYDLLKILFEKKNINKNLFDNLILLVNQLHFNENLKFKNNCSSSVYLKLVGSVIDMLNFTNNFLEKNKFAEDLFYEIANSLISNILFHKDFLNHISEISFLILNSKSSKIQDLFEKIIYFVFKAEIFHFLSYLILTDKNSLCGETPVPIENKTNFFINILDYIQKNFINFHTNKNIEIDFGFVLTIIYLLDQTNIISIREKLLNILAILNTNKKHLDISCFNFNNLFGLNKELRKNPEKIEIKQIKQISLDIINEIVNNKNEIMVNKENLQKIINNSKNFDFNLFIAVFEYFIVNSDENNNFEIFFKMNKFFTKKLMNKKTNKKNINFNIEFVSKNDIEYFSKILFSENIKNYQNSTYLIQLIFTNILDFYDSDENCLIFIIKTLIDYNTTSKLEENKDIPLIKYSNILIRKIAESPLLEKINFHEKNNKEMFEFVDFVDLLIKYNISSSDLVYFNKINFVEILEDLLNELKLSNSPRENNLDIIFYIFELILKENSYALDYSVISLELLEFFSNSSQIDSNFLTITNNLLSLLSASNIELEKQTNEYNKNNINKYLCEKIEKIILLVCEFLANKNSSNPKENFSKLFEFTNKKNYLPESEEQDNIEMEENINNIQNSFEYLNILNILFLALNKTIINLNQINIERDTVIGVINKTFDIFYSKKIKENNNTDIIIENDISFKFKKDIFSVILNSIINFVISLLNSKQDNLSLNKNDDINVFFEYIQTLVKLTILNFTDEIYLDNILKKFLNLLKPFDNRLISCLFVNINYYNIENNFNKYLNKQENNSNNLKTKNIIEKFSCFYDIEKTSNNYYNNIISNYFAEILELNYQKFDEFSVLNILQILEDILSTISCNKNNIYYIISNDKENSQICFFENLRNIIINLCTKILGYTKNLFFLNDSIKLKENPVIYNIFFSINTKILKNYKLTNQLMNTKEETFESVNKNLKSKKNSEENSELLNNLCNVFMKNLKIFEDNIFDVIIEANILHYLIMNLYKNSEEEKNTTDKDQILLCNFLLGKYLNLIKLDSAGIIDSNLKNKNNKNKSKNLEHYKNKYSDNLKVFSKLIGNFDKENVKNFENINLIFSILSEIIVFSTKYKSLNSKDHDNNDIFILVKESKRLDYIMLFLNFDENLFNKDQEIPLNYYNSKFSIFNFMIKFFTVYDLKLFDLFNKFLKNISAYLDVLYTRFYNTNNENKDILLTVLKNINDLVEKRSEFLSPILEDLVYKISQFYENNYTAEIINKIFDTLAKKQLFDIIFKSVKYSFKNYENFVQEKNSTLNLEKLKYKNLNNKINSILTYFNTAIKYSDKLVITDMNLKIIKFIYRILLDTNYNNTSKNEDLSDSILTCLKSLILKMNEKQFKILFDNFLVIFLKEEFDSKNPEDNEILKVSKYKLNNCIISLQVFNVIFDTLNSIFVNYFEKYKNILIQILNFVNTQFCSVNKNMKGKKKDRNFFDENYDSENSKFSYLNLSNLALRNIALFFNYDTNIILQESIEEILEPISNQVKIIF